MKRILSFVLVVMMLVTLMPLSAFADHDITITQQPASQTVTEGSDAVFTVAATMKGIFNDQNISYFWYRADQSLSEATALGTGATLTLENVSADMDGMRIRCVVYHVGDVRTHGVISDVAVLNVTLREPCEEHTLVFNAGTAPTCCSEGVIDYWQCEVCHRMYAESAAVNELNRADIVLPVDPAAHELNHVDRVEASCIKNGNIEHWKCALCGNCYDNALGEGEPLAQSAVTLSSSNASHQLTLVPYKAATCIEEGNIEYYVCDVCGKYFRPNGLQIFIKNNVVLEKTDHTSAFDYDDNYHWQYCTVCGIEIENTRAPHNDNGRKANCSDKAVCECGIVHGDYGDHLYNAVITAPTCTAEGYTTYICKYCNDSYVDNRTAALGHSFGKWTVTKAATCTTDGVETRYCSHCGVSETRAISATGHSYAKTTTAATCTEDGYSTYTCKTCGDSYKSDYTSKLGHSFGAWQVYKAASCTENGVNIRYCSRCHISETSVAEASGHYYEKMVVAPSCTADGYTLNICKYCGDSYKSDFTSRLGHDFGAWQTTKAATCTEDGVETSYCSRCDATMTCVVEAIGHSFDAVVTAPTCTAGGFTTHTCKNCNYSYIDNRVDALGHDFSAWQTTKEATCTEKGSETRSCSRCHMNETCEIAALGHTLTAATCTEPAYCTVCHEYVGEANGHTLTAANCTDPAYCTVCLEYVGEANGHTLTAATCTEPAYCTVCHEYIGEALGHTLTEATCTEPAYCLRCHEYVGEALGHLLTEATCERPAYCLRCHEYVGEALGHSFGDWTVTKEATCTEKGVETRYCERCEEFETRDINELGHSWDAGVVTTEAGEYTEGVKTFTCSTCNETKTEVIPALGHTHNYEAVVTAPTCTEQGYTTYTCACGDSYTDNYVAALGHSFGEWTVTKAAACAEKGALQRVCSVCGAIETIETNPLGHAYINGICDTCGDIDLELHEHIYVETARADVTCTTDGYVVYTCVCGQSYTAIMDRATGHNFSGACCDYCGEANPNYVEEPIPSISINAASGKPTLKWNAVDNAVKYEVYRATSKDGSYTKYYTTANTSYTNTSAVPGTTYYYKVVAVNENGYTSEYSSIKYITCDCAAPVVTISNDSASGKPTLKWAAVEGATKYEIWRATSSTGEYTKYYTTTSTSYTNTSAVAGYTYYYKVKAICGASSYGDSAFSNAVSRTCDCAAPVATISISAASGKPTLKWAAVEGATGYEIWRATSSTGEYVKYYTTTNTSYTNTSAVAGSTYYYKVKAICGRSSYGDSAFSAVKYITCDCAAPVVSITLSSGHPKLSWTAVDGADKYVIYRSTDGKNFKSYDTTTKTTYTNSSASAGTTYYYKVVAVSNVSTYADSAYSNVVSVKAK